MFYLLFHAVTVILETVVTQLIWARGMAHMACFAARLYFTKIFSFLKLLEMLGVMGTKLSIPS